MSLYDHSIWVVDTQAIATAIAPILSDKLKRPVRPVAYSDIPDGPCDLALVEILLPGACGLALAAQLRAEANVSVAVWGTQPSPLYTWVAWQVGLNGCLDKDTGWEETATTILSLTQGASIWPPRLWEQTQIFEAEVGWRLRRLNETDWMRWLDVTRGRSLKQLGWAWGLTPRGAAKAIDRLCEKLQITDKIEAAALAWSAGLTKTEHDLEWSDAITLYRTRYKPHTQSERFFKLNFPNN